jgi:hypothetical protein
MTHIVTARAGPGRAPGPGTGTVPRTVTRYAGGVLVTQASNGHGNRDFKLMSCHRDSFWQALKLFRRTVTLAPVRT